MDDVKNEAQAAEQMIKQIEERQAEKAAKKAEQAEEVAEATAHAKDVAKHVAAGEVAAVQVSDEVTTAAEFDPATEAEAGARMIDDLLSREKVHEAKRAKQNEEFVEDQREEAVAAARVAESVKASFEHLKEKLVR